MAGHSERNVLTISHPNDQVYAFFFDDATTDLDLLTVWGEMVEDPELDFSWEDFDTLKANLAALRENSPPP